MKTLVPMEKVLVMVGDIEMEALKPKKLDDNERRNLYLTIQTEDVDEIFTLISGENHPKRFLFIDMAMRIYDQLNDHRKDKVSKAGFFIWRTLTVFDDHLFQYFYRRGGIDGALFEETKAWVELFQAVIKSNPLLQVHQALVDIGYDEDYRKWPYGYELKILDWVKSGDYLNGKGEPAFRGITEDEFSRLRHIISDTGQWLVKDDENELKIVAVNLS